MAGLSPQLIERFNAGDRRALARLITLLDNHRDPHELLAQLGPAGGRAGVVGITGAPGVGKSTLLGRMIGVLRRRGRRVAVLAVDPESPISGGALLGDRLRMSEMAADDPDVFIRSLSSHGTAGGLSGSVRSICRLLERFGYDLILVETVGVGQGEMAVLRVADVVMLMVMPGAGDGVQWEKAGLIEVAHLVVLNKADHDGVERAEQELRDALEAGNGSGRSPTPILRTIAAQDVGVEPVVDKLLELLTCHNDADWRQLRTEIVQEAEMRLGQRLRELAEADPAIEAMARDVAQGRADLDRVTGELLARLLPRLID